MKSAPDTQPTFPAMALRERMSEDEFQKWVTDLAELYGWSWHHETDSRRSKAGFLDLLMWNPRQGRLLFAELKREKDYKVSKAQQVTLQELAEVSERINQHRHLPLPMVLVELWRPSDMEQIEEILR